MRDGHKRGMCHGQLLVIDSKYSFAKSTINTKGNPHITKQTEGLSHY